MLLQSLIRNPKFLLNSYSTPINFFRFSMLTDKLSEKQQKKSAQEFKKQIEHMANKPSFTLMDYKQRVSDELINLKTSFKKNLSKQAQEMEKKLEVQKKIMNALYEEELVGGNKVNITEKKSIALVVGIDLEQVKAVFKKAIQYQKMHRYLRSLNRSGKPLPESINELRYGFQKKVKKTFKIQDRKQKMQRFTKSHEDKTFKIDEGKEELIKIKFFY